MKLTYAKAKIPPIIFLICLTFNIVALIAELEVWMIGFVSLCICWHIAIYTKQLAAPNNVVKIIISVSGCIILAITTAKLGFLVAMVHLLVMAYVLKPLEVSHDRDVFQLLIIGVLVLFCSFIFNQSIYFSFWVTLVFIANLLLIAKAFNIKQPFNDNVKPVFSIFLQALPLCVLLFFIFPKLSPFWQMPYAKNAETGLSDTVKVGDIANLALSNELAFRAEFEKAILPHSELYWRSIVLQDFDGIQWKNRVKAVGVNKPAVTADEGNLYHVFVEPTHKKWIFSLANSYPLATSGQLKSLSDGTFISQKKIRKTMAYELVQIAKPASVIPLSGIEKTRNLTVPASSNPRLFDKGVALANQYNDKQKIVAAVLNEFNTQPYQYTLKPPTLSNNSLDEFYFETKSGFCEHYASSFTYLMRSAGIPARLVLGYMGGEYNAQANYYNVYQRNAHAWSEVYLEGRGWIRIDPTAAVHPDRVNQGFSQFLLDEQADLNEVPEFFNTMWRSNLMSAIRASFDVIDYNWTKWVVSYSQDKQVSLMSTLFSLKNQWKTILAVVLSLIFVVLISYLFYRFTGRNQIVLSQENTTLRKLIKRSSLLGIDWQSTDTVQEYFDRVVVQYPELRTPVVHFVQCYNAIVYKGIEANEQERNQAELAALGNEIQRSIKILLKKST